MRAVDEIELRPPASVDLGQVVEQFVGQPLDARPAVRRQRCAVSRWATARRVVDVRRRLHGTRTTGTGSGSAARPASVGRPAPAPRRARRTRGRAAVARSRRSASARPSRTAGQVDRRAPGRPRSLVRRVRVRRRPSAAAGRGKPGSRGAGRPGARSSAARRRSRPAARGSGCARRRRRRRPCRRPVLRKRPVTSADHSRRSRTPCTTSTGVFVARSSAAAVRFRARRRRAPCRNGSRIRSSRSCQKRRRSVSAAGMIRRITGHMTAQPWRRRVASNVSSTARCRSPSRLGPLPISVTDRNRSGRVTAAAARRRTPRTSDRRRGPAGAGRPRRARREGRWRVDRACAAHRRVRSGRGNRTRGGGTRRRPAPGRSSVKSSLEPTRPAHRTTGVPPSGPNRSTSTGPRAVSRTSARCVITRSQYDKLGQGGQPPRRTGGRCCGR